MTQFHHDCCCDGGATDCSCQAYFERCGCFEQNSVTITWRGRVWVDTNIGSQLVAEYTYTLSSVGDAVEIDCRNRGWTQLQFSFLFKGYTYAIRGINSNFDDLGPTPPCYAPCDGCSANFRVCDYENLYFGEKTAQAEYYGTLTVGPDPYAYNHIDANATQYPLILRCLGACGCGCRPCARAQLFVLPDASAQLGTEKQETWTPCCVQTCPGCPGYQSTVTEDGYSFYLPAFNVVSGCNCHTSSNAWTNPVFWSSGWVDGPFYNCFPGTVPMPIPQFMVGTPEFVTCATCQQSICDSDPTGECSFPVYSGESSWFSHTYDWTCGYHDFDLGDVYDLCSFTFEFKYRWECTITVSVA